MSDEGNGIGSGEMKPAVPAGRPFRVLVVDDDKDVATSIVRALECLGHTATNCGHAQEALEVIARQSFDLLLVDYRMPDMTGLDLITLLREEGRKIPAIMMTGHFATGDRVRVEQLGISTILRKPISLPMLSHALEEQLTATRAAA
ncbi:MAG TPA: response regulator [Candidatus Methylacidiphilales bacterium]|jgi:CheY-like chemotaxis protein|nr:response regulator [Candidatus Methylacidiphilales bacterium]